MMPTDGETIEFKEWWSKTCDPSETGRTRMMAAHAFEAGRQVQRQIHDEDAFEQSRLDAEAESFNL
jgi:hypothetical protein